MLVISCKCSKYFENTDIFKKHAAPRKNIFIYMKL